MDVVVTIASNRPGLADECRQALAPVPSRVLPGGGALSWASLVNQSIATSPTDPVFFANDKARATAADVARTCELLDSGYGFVGLYSFGFFGLWRETVRRVGWFDERFLGGGHEDLDYLFRLAEADIAVFEERSIAYLSMPSSWPCSRAAMHFQAKWQRIGELPAGHVVTRMLPELHLPYDLGVVTPRDLRPWAASVLMPYWGPLLTVTFTCPT